MNPERNYHAVVKLSNDAEGKNSRELVFNATSTVADLEQSVKDMFCYESDNFELSLHCEDGKVVSFCIRRGLMCHGWFKNSYLERLTWRMRKSREKC